MGTRSHDHQLLPADVASVDALAAKGLEYRLLDAADEIAFNAWWGAVSHGFHSADALPAELRDLRDGIGWRRLVGVWDPGSPDASRPVATVDGFPAEFSVPGRRRIDAWAISAVTVATTHRGRGIARAMLEGELRTARALDLPVAALTVSESGLYGRYGFGAATLADDLEFDTRRIRWEGGVGSGRLDEVSPRYVYENAAELFDAASLAVPGDLVVHDFFRRRLTGQVADHPRARELRAVRHADADGRTKGFVLYRIDEDAQDNTHHTATVQYLLAPDDEAYLSLWHYLFDLPLVTTVKAPLRSVDEPVRWVLGDHRAVRNLTRDHLWLRPLDVPRMLLARDYSAADSIVLDVDDQYGWAAGRYLLETSAAGAPRVTEVMGTPAQAASIRLGVAALGSMFLGGVSARTLMRAGLIAEEVDGSVDRVDAVFRSPVAPWLSVWF